MTRGSTFVGVILEKKKNQTHPIMKEGQAVLFLHIYLLQKKKQLWIKSGKK